MLSERAGTRKCFLTTAPLTALPVRVGLVLAALLCVGCGSLGYSARSGAAQERLAEARELGAEELAPYEFFSAQAHLHKAESEAAEADYGDAIELAASSEAFSARAIELSRAARRGALP